MGACKPCNLEKKSGFLLGYLRYNYESAKGKSSNDLDAPVSYFEKPAEGQEPIELPEPEDVYLDYDRTHKAVFNLRLKSPRNFGFITRPPIGCRISPPPLL